MNYIFHRTETDISKNLIIFTCITVRVSTWSFVLKTKKSFFHFFLQNTLLNLLNSSIFPLWIILSVYMSVYVRMYVGHTFSESFIYYNFLHFIEISIKHKIFLFENIRIFCLHFVPMKNFDFLQFYFVSAKISYVASVS